MNDRSRVAFVGAVRASEVALRTILSLDEAKVFSVVTKKSSTFNADHRDLSTLAEQHKIPWKHVRDINAPHIQERLKEQEPDLLFASGWSRLLEKRCSWTHAAWRDWVTSSAVTKESRATSSDLGHRPWTQAQRLDVLYSGRKGR